MPLSHFILNLLLGCLIWALIIAMLLWLVGCDPTCMQHILTFGHNDPNTPSALVWMALYGPHEVIPVNGQLVIVRCGQLELP
ncbi:MAG: hypothetical protein JW709_00405 [Sedimentisphaerales bacterium]|nr:hypothetical protein [Sedimentisphaerales bacterium]